MCVPVFRALFQYASLPLFLSVSLPYTLRLMSVCVTMTHSGVTVGVCLFACWPLWLFVFCIFLHFPPVRSGCFSSYFLKVIFKIHTTTKKCSHNESAFCVKNALKAPCALSLSQNALHTLSLSPTQKAHINSRTHDESDGPLWLSRSFGSHHVWVLCVCACSCAQFVRCTLLVFVVVVVVASAIGFAFHVKCSIFITFPPSLFDQRRKS